jgi:hypothetical protein
LTATITLNGVTLTNTKPVTIIKLIATALTINGVSSIQVGSTSNYTATVTLNSGVSQTVVPTWSFGNANATVDAAGKVTAVTAGSDVLTAKYTLPNTTVEVSASKTITLVAVATVVYPYYGTGPALPTDWQSFITGLQYRGPNGSQVVSNMSYDCIGSTTYMYFAYPVSYGLAMFFDKLSSFYGGWGGAGNSGQGPSAASLAAGGDTPLTTTITINGVATPFYVYRSDFANLGTAANNKWDVSAA